jgi:oligopeptidase B
MKIFKKPFKMKQFLKFSALICIIFATGCKSDIKMNKDVKTPEAEIQAKSLTIHNSTRIDNYFWMRLTDDQKTAKNKDAQTQKVEAYLNSENEYFDKVTASTNNFQKELFEEMKGRIKEDDTSVPYFRNDYFYITRFEKGNQYPIYSRIVAKFNRYSKS